MGGLEFIQSAIDHGELVLDVIEPPAIVDLGLRPGLVGLDHEGIESRAEVSESRFDLPHRLPCCVHGILLLLAIFDGPNAAKPATRMATTPCSRDRGPGTRFAVPSSFGTG